MVAAVFLDELSGFVIELEVVGDLTADHTTLMNTTSFSPGGWARRPPRAVQTS
jgi:hypothetical protein